MNRKTWTRLGIAVLAVFVAISMLQPAPADAARKKILKLAGKEQETLDPHRSILGQTQSGVRLMYRGLLKFAIIDGKVTTAKAQPDLAVGRTAAQGETPLLRLRRGGRSQQGQEHVEAEVGDGKGHVRSLLCRAGSACRCGRTTSAQPVPLPPKKS